MWSRYGLRKALNPTRPSKVLRFLWHGCKFLNVQMELIMWVLPKIWNTVYLNIKEAKAQNIHHGAYRSNWYIRKNMKELLMPILEKSKFKIGVAQNVKH